MFKFISSILVSILFYSSVYAEVVKDIKVTNNDRISKETILIFSKIEIGKDYALPIIDNKLETKNARDKIWRVKSSAQSKNLARDVLKKHTSSSPNKFKVA